MANLLKIDSIMFRVSNLGTATSFYTEALGLKRVWRDDEHMMVGLILSNSDSEIVIHTDPNIPNPDFSFLVENVEQFCIEYEKRGYRILAQPFDVRSGKYAVLADPDGNKINIIDLTKFGNKPRYD